MKKKRLPIWLGIWLLGASLPAGCDRMEEKDAEPEAAAAGEVHNGVEHERVAGGEPAGDESLAIDPEMLRDLKVTTFAAELRPAGEGITAPGQLEVDPRAYAEVGSPIPARVVRLIADPGRAVRRGEPLAELQSAELGRARADLAAARARADLAGKTVERKRGLAAERIVSRGELQRAEADLAAAAAELEAAQAALAALGVPGGSRADLSRFSLPSPIAGTVLERRAVQGQAADPATPLFRIADLSRLDLVVHTPERDVLRIREGADAEVTLVALPGQKLRGTVAWIGREVDPHSRTVPVRIDLANPAGQLRPGMFATARLATGGEGEPVVAVPAAALQRLEDRWVVFLQQGRGRFEVRPVERGRDLGGEVAVLAGLRPGEPVIVEGAFLLRAEAEKRAGGGEHHHH